MRNMNRWVFLVATLASAPTFSQSEVGPAELTLFAGNGFGGTFQTESGADVRLDDDSSFGLIFDYEYDTNTQWEVIYLEQTTAADTSALFPTRPSIETDIKYLQGGGTYRGSGDGPRPYLAGTLDSKGACSALSSIRNQRSIAAPASGKTSACSSWMGTCSGRLMSLLA